MRVEALTAEGFRNIGHITLSADPQMNILYGKNAQGKTNLLEAIGLFSSGKSFRGAKDSEMIGFDREWAKLTLTFTDSRRTQQAELILSGVRSYRKNGVKMPLQEKTSDFCCTVFSPRHLSLITDGPQARRSFLDTAISALQPRYGAYLTQYERLIGQKNALLKELWKNPRLADTIPLWDQQIARAGTVLTCYRNDYVKKLNQTAGVLYSGMTGKREQITLSYHSTVFGDTLPEEYHTEAADAYLEALTDSAEEDRKNGVTMIGVHRDDMVVEIDGVPARLYGSQGQKRSAAVCCKLGEALLLQQILKEPPVMLLDDVMSELDEERQAYICNRLRQMQVFITCCDISHVLMAQNKTVFRVTEGRLEV